MPGPLIRRNTAVMLLDGMPPGLAPYGVSVSNGINFHDCYFYAASCPSGRLLINLKKDKKMKKGIIIAARSAAVLVAVAAAVALMSDVTDACPLWLAVAIKAVSLAVLTVCFLALPAARERMREMGYDSPLRWRR